MIEIRAEGKSMTSHSCISFSPDIEVKGWLTDFKGTDFFFNSATF